jgi:eukaryotic-like serine/threonine-protein kinase
MASTPVAPARLQPGSVLGRYEVIARVGVGGMGEVYRARDPLLDRMVALKTIAAKAILDSASQPRFEQERRIAASLDHPHICRLLDAGHDHGLDYFAMEFLEGESLASQLERGALPVHTALGYAIEIAGALQHAHGHGIIHRDLKPANVFLTPTGAKVLDFGLAKLHHRDHHPTEHEGDVAALAATHPGTILGSAPYMSPERLQWREGDERSDIFAFGLVFYEMLTGRRAFGGTSAAALIAAIISAEHAPMRLPGAKGDEIEWVVGKCLAKNPNDRWQSSGDLEIVLKRIAGRGLRAVEPARRRPLAAVAVIVSLLVALLVGMAINPRARNAPPAGGPTAFTVPPPEGGSFTPTEGSIQTAQLALAPDGQTLAFVAAASDGVSELWLRPFDSLLPRPVPGTAGASYPFWSPDGRSIGFFTPGLLRRIDLGGGPARTIASAANGRGATWSRDGVILFAPSTLDVIHRVAASGGAVTEETRMDPSRADNSHRWPFFLPDGRRYLYFARSVADAHEGIYLGSLDSAASTLVVNSGHGGIFVPPHWVLSIAGETLVARAIDHATGQATGDPVPIAERVGGSSNFYAAISASAVSGSIAYASPVLTSGTAWVDRAGKRLGVPIPAGHHVDFQMSPDARALAVATLDPHTGGSDVYVVDLARGTRTRLTSTRATDASPVWSPDGVRLIFRSNRAGVHDLYIRDAHGPAPERVFLRSASAKYPTSWSPDGRFVVFHTRDNETGWDVMLAAADRSAPPRPIVRSAFNEMQGQFSPDGAWLAYSSDESSRTDVYAQSLTPGGPRVQVSMNGGSDPKWRGDGNEVYYIAADGQLTAVSFRPRGATAQPTSPQRLFAMPTPRVSAPYTSAYNVAPDGQRFLVPVPGAPARSRPIIVLLNQLPQSGR